MFRCDGWQLTCQWYMFVSGTCMKRGLLSEGSATHGFRACLRERIEELKSLTLRLDNDI